MTWFLALSLAIAAFALAAFAFRIARGLYSTLLAALSLGLAGYAMQASPGLPAAPAQVRVEADGPDFEVVDARRAMLAEADRSKAATMFPADAMARQGRFGDAVQFLGVATTQNPRDFEAWLAQGNALVEHAGGVLTPAALYAWRRAAALKPDHPAPGYFLGVSLIRQGQIMEARQVWTDTLAGTPAGATGRAPLANALERLNGLLDMAAAQGEEPAPPPTTPDN